MLKKNPSYRRPLNKTQTRTLQLIYKFRFITIPLLASIRNVHVTTIYEQLSILESQGYLDKRYDKSYRLQGRPSEYYLSAKGIGCLKDDPLIDNDSLRLLYGCKRKTLKEIDKRLAIARIYDTHRTQIGSNRKAEIFTSIELQAIEAVLTPKPDLLIFDDENPDGLFVEIQKPGTPFWAIRKRVLQHSDASEEDWVWGDSDAYPDVLLLVSSQFILERVNEWTEGLLEDFEVSAQLSLKEQSAPYRSV